MTNKRKIQILKKVIKRFEKLIPKFNKNKYAYHVLGGSFGICDQINKELPIWEWYETAEIKKIFKIKMPRIKSHYAWNFDKKGYQARINACKKAIERLSK